MKNRIVFSLALTILILISSSAYAQPGWNVEKVWEMVFWTSSKAVDIVGNYAYVAAGSKGLLILDTSDPANPVFTGYIDTQGANDVVVSNGFAYIADYHKLDIIDVSDPSSPFEVGQAEGPSWTYSVAVQGDYAYVGASDLHIFDVNDPYDPVQVGFCDMTVVHGIAVQGDYAYVADNSNLQVVDVSNPFNPFIAGTYNAPG